MARHSILQKYDSLKKEIKNNLYSKNVTEILSQIYSECISFLNPLKKVSLISKVENKNYFAFNYGQKISRAINLDLFDPNYEKWINFSHVLNSKKLDKFIKNDITKMLYSMAISFCACIDLIKEGVT